VRFDEDSNVLHFGFRPLPIQWAIATGSGTADASGAAWAELVPQMTYGCAR